MLWVTLTVVSSTYSQSNKFVTGVWVKVTSDSKLNDILVKFLNI